MEQDRHCLAENVKPIVNAALSWGGQQRLQCLHHDGAAHRRPNLLLQLHPLRMDEPVRGLLFHHADSNLHGIADTGTIILKYVG